CRHTVVVGEVPAPEVISRLTRDDPKLPTLQAVPSDEELNVVGVHVAGHPLGVQQRRGYAPYRERRVKRRAGSSGDVVLLVAAQQEQLELWLHTPEVRVPAVAHRIVAEPALDRAVSNLGLNGLSRRNPPRGPPCLATLDRH